MTETAFGLIETCRGYFSEVGEENQGFTLRTCGKSDVCVHVGFWVCLIDKLYNHATGDASQHIWCLSQARIMWEGCDRKGIQHKNGGGR